MTHVRNGEALPPIFVGTFQSSRPTLKEMRDEGYEQAKLDVLAVLMKHDPDAYLRNATRIRELKP